MTAGSRTLTVSRERIESARAAIEIAGGEQYVEPDVVAIAHAAPTVEPESPMTRERIESARAAIELAGGEELVDPRVVAIAHSTPAGAVAER